MSIDIQFCVELCGQRIFLGISVRITVLFTKKSEKSRLKELTEKKYELN